MFHKEIQGWWKFQNAQEQRIEDLESTCEIITASFSIGGILSRQNS